MVFLFTKFEYSIILWLRIINKIDLIFFFFGLYFKCKNYRVILFKFIYLLFICIILFYFACKCKLVIFSEDSLKYVQFIYVFIVDDVDVDVYCVIRMKFIRNQVEDWKWFCSNQSLISIFFSSKNVNTVNLCMCVCVFVYLWNDRGHAKENIKRTQLKWWPAAIESIFLCIFHMNELKNNGKWWHLCVVAWRILEWICIKKLAGNLRIIWVS